MVLTADSNLARSTRRRQTSTGWNDEEHELNNVQEPPGNYSEYDMVYRPDPISAVLVNPTGSEGWAVGGFVDTADSNGALDTADVDPIACGCNLCR